MKNTFLLLLIFCNTLQAQHKQAPTQFDKFINQPAIEWADYASDTIRFEKINLNKTLTDRLNKREIKASLPLSNGLDDVNHIKFFIKDSLDQIILYPQTTFDVLDDNDVTGSAVKTVRYQLDLNSSSVTDVTQILYVENKTLRSYVTWVSPLVIPITTSAGISLGMAAYFSSCFNFKYNYTPTESNKKIFLSQTKKMIRLDTVQKENKLKELYGRNLIETLWPHILENKIAVYLFESNKKIQPAEICTDLITKIMIPIYDSVGNVTGKFIKAPLDPSVFTAAELLQEWYYDHTRNIVFNKIKEAYLYAAKMNTSSQAIESVPILKIVFN